ncbi:heavy-metal-associated domain-containing protein [Sediminispirochaeta bajacaliforniensis]|uniref:heavy-metal-associated domain-containing protein n=1 Tax=Sediminispirochaeta bajacaliforniensis TaxID=148 RepID=UPI00036513E0|nr:cation transporter [Sediminispirochaeta bajacaliforniensis]
MKYIFDVPDVSCGHCKMRIESALGKETEVTSCNVDIEAKTAEVESSLDADQLIHLIDEAGYDATLRA